MSIALSDAAHLAAHGNLGGGSPEVSIRPNDGPNGLWHKDGQGVVVTLSWRDVDGSGQPVAKPIVIATTRTKWREAIKSALASGEG